MLDIGASLRYARCDTPQYPSHIVCRDLYPDVKVLAGIRFPLNMYPVLRLGTARSSGDLAGMCVNAQTLTFSQQADNRISRDRLAAGRQLDRHSFRTSDD
jgi:hypothetical protein